jgi:hypothetical protein
MLLALALSGIASAQVGSRFPGILPNATITSDETDTARDAQGPPPETSTPAPETVSPPTHHSRPRHHPSVPDRAASAAVEPSHAMLKLKRDAWAYARPGTSSRTLERVHAGKFLDITGSTHYYLQAKLKNGATGYVPISAVDITRPTDRVMRLTTDAAVLSEPNRYGKRLAEVHQGHDVHVIGVSLNYMKIRMKGGIEGFIPMTAAE